MRRWMVLLAVVAVGASATGVAGAGSGAERRAPTELTFDFFCGNGFCQTVGLPVGDDWVFMGKVESPKRACRAGRKVVVFETIFGELKRMGSDRSDSRGNWFVRRPNYPPTTAVWFAKAEKKKLGRGETLRAGQEPEDRRLSGARAVAAEEPVLPR